MAHGCAIHLYDTSAYDAQSRGVSPYGQKSRLFLLLKGDLVGDSVRNPVASGVVRGGKFTQRKQVITSLDTQPFPLSFKYLQAFGRALKRGSILTTFEGILYLSRRSSPGHTSLPAGKPFASVEANPTRGRNVPKKVRGRGYGLDETTHYDHYFGRR